MLQTANFAFARGASVAKIFEYFRAEGFHVMSASGLYDVKVIVPEVPGAPSGGIAWPFNSSNTALELAARFQTALWREMTIGAGRKFCVKDKFAVGQNAEMSSIA